MILSEARKRASHKNKTNQECTNVAAFKVEAAVSPQKSTDHSITGVPLFTNLVLSLFHSDDGFEQLSRAQSPVPDPGRARYVNSAPLK